MTAFAIGVVAALPGCGEESHEIRYRIAIAVEVDSEVKMGSSVIQTLFYGGGGKNQPYRYYTSTDGVAPAIDLGRHGWLVAAMDMYPTEVANRKKQFGLSCKDPRIVEGLLDAFRLDAADLVKLREGKRELVDGNLPAFIWFPRDRHYTAAQQICPEEFARVIGADVRLKSATIEIASGAPLKTALEINVPWLDEMRVDQRHGLTAQHGIFKPKLWDIERPGVKR